MGGLAQGILFFQRQIHEWWVVFLYGCIETVLSLLLETEIRLDSSDKVL
jgi:hypothetical protein